jgi:hypothetical protein
VIEPQWKPVISRPANLTVAYVAAVLTADDPVPWCQQKAAELLGPRARPKQVSLLAHCLEEYAKYFRSKKVTYGALFFYPDFTRIPPRAETQIFLFVEDAHVGPITLTRAKDLFAPDESSFGETEMTETEVPAGPALRVHRFRKLEPDKRRTEITEELVWVICPPGSLQYAMIGTTWSEPGFSKAGTTIADDMANNFRTEPVEIGSD